MAINKIFNLLRIAKGETPQLMTTSWTRELEDSFSITDAAGKTLAPDGVHKFRFVAEAQDEDKLPQLSRWNIGVEFDGGAPHGATVAKNLSYAEMTQQMKKQELLALAYMGYFGSELQAAEDRLADGAPVTNVLRYLNSLDDKDAFAVDKIGEKAIDAKVAKARSGLKP